MLGNLLRYEMVASGRILGPMYVIFLALGLMSLFPLLTGDGGNGLAVMMMFLLYIIGIVSFVILVQRFSRGLYGEEGYWARALPVSAGMHLWSKLLSAVFWLALAVLGFIIVMVVNIVAEQNSFSIEGEPGILESAMIQNPHLILDVVLVILLLLLSFGKFMLEVYAAISLAQLVGKAENLVAVLLVVAFTVVESVLEKLLGIYSDSWMQLGELYGLGDALKTVTSSMTGSTIFSLGFGVIYFIISWAILKYRPTIR